MSVLNRKMFRSDAARKALSEMGGIVSFANGGGTGNQDPIGLYPNPDLNQRAAEIEADQMGEYLYSAPGRLFKSLLESARTEAEKQQVLKFIQNPENASRINAPQNLTQPDIFQFGGPEAPDPQQDFAENQEKITAANQLAATSDVFEERGPRDISVIANQGNTLAGEITPDDNRTTQEKLMSKGVDPRIANAAGQKIGEKISGGTPAEVDTVKKDFLKQLNVFRDADKQSVKNYKDFQKKVDEKKEFGDIKEMFAEYLGAPKDKKQDFYEMLAMIGFSIASGESPSAVKNIADGMLTGLSIRREDRKLDQEREDSINMLALETMLGRQATREEAKIAAAAAETKYAREVLFEKLKSDLSIREELKKNLGVDNRYLAKTKTRDFFGVDYEVYIPTASNVGVLPEVNVPNAMVDAKFESKVGRTEKHRGLVREAYGLIEAPGDQVGGIGGFINRLTDRFRGVVGEERANAVLGTELTPATKYEKIMNVLAAQLAPDLLGESGRTISDQDRRRVAEILGMNVTEKDGMLFFNGFQDFSQKSDKDLMATLVLLDQQLLLTNQGVIKQYNAYSSGIPGKKDPPVSKGPIYEMSEEEFLGRLGALNIA